jgi:hypothetical protein
MQRAWSILALVFWMSDAPAPAHRIDAPSSRPSLAALVADLDHPSSQRREAAFSALLALGRADLPALLAAVKSSRPLSQAAVSQLHSAAVHVYLSEEPYLAGNSGYLGILLQPFRLMMSDTPVDGSERWAVTVVERRPGLAAFRYLQTADIILGVSDQPPLTSRDDLANIIMKAGAGSRVTLKVLRQNRVMEIPVVLSARPLGIDGPGSQAELTEEGWLKAGESYWQENFAKVAGEHHEDED